MSDKKGNVVDLLGVKEENKWNFMEDIEDLNNFLNSKVIAMVHFAEIRRRVLAKRRHELEIEFEFNEEIKCNFKIEIERV